MSKREWTADDRRWMEPTNTQDVMAGRRVCKLLHAERLANEDADEDPAWCVTNDAISRIESAAATYSKGAELIAWLRRQSKTRRMEWLRGRSMAMWGTESPAIADLGKVER